jgi:hypothetical protein
LGITVYKYCPTLTSTVTACSMGLASAAIFSASVPVFTRRCKSKWGGGWGETFCCCVFRATRLLAGMDVD